MIEAINALNENIRGLTAQVGALGVVVSELVHSQEFCTVSGIHIEVGISPSSSFVPPRPQLDLPLIEVLRLVGQAELRQFDDEARAFFPDFETEHPMTGEVEQSEAMVPDQIPSLRHWTVVLDGDEVTIFRVCEDEIIYDCDIQTTRVQVAPRT